MNQFRAGVFFTASESKGRSWRTFSVDTMVMDSGIQRALKSLVPVVTRDSKSLATAAFLSYSGRHFVLTAAHVARSLIKTEWYLWLEGTGLLTLGNPHFAFSVRELDFQPGLDIAVVQITNQEDVAHIEKNHSFLTEQDLLLGELAADTRFFLLGYPGEWAVWKQGLLQRPKYLSCLGSRADEAMLTESLIPFSPDRHVAFRIHEQPVNEHKKLVDLPRLPGISGCPIWAILDSGDERWSASRHLKVVAIQNQEIRREWIRGTQIRGLLDSLVRLIEEAQARCPNSRNSGPSGSD